MACLQVPTTADNATHEWQIAWATPTKLEQMQNRKENAVLIVRFSETPEPKFGTLNL